ncbi:MLO-like protein 4 isoform X5 [Vigna angularis]|uniref:MLO-like protein 4 isoform X5 n=1 Tax=Phaseolus angularis TaxID=3914 RepID=UPI0022B365B9|nr:MLO-like protein 4 isoform X5 [Vigna angularis]
MGEENGEGRSLADTPTYAVATVITVLVSFSFLFQGTLKKLVKWLDRTKRKSLLSALEKIKEAELMLFGLLSLLMGHWIIFVAKICVKSSVISSRFFPCPLEKNSVKRVVWLSSEYSNRTVVKGQVNNGLRNYCPEGHESLASYESLEQLHRFVFVLGVTHVTYSFLAVALAMIKRIFRYIAGEHGKTKQRLLLYKAFKLCFSRQFWSSIHRADYMALRLGFITNHDLPTTYDFHNYMLRSMDEEFRDIVGVSVLLWVYAICCIFLNFHGSNFYFWLSFVPAILILIIGTKLHRVVVKLAVEIINRCPNMKPHQFNLRDELFWFGKPRFLLRLIQLISFLVSNIVFPFCFFIADTLTFFLPVVIFQNAFEMATFLWSLWEIKDPSCFMNNRTFIVIRLSFGVISQVWCSFITFPLYVIITQMGSRFKKTVVSENVRKSLSKWQRRVKERQSYSSALLTATSAASISSFISGNERGLISEEGSSSGTKDICLSYLDHVSRTQADASFPSYENDPHDIIHDSSPPLS